MKLHRLIVALAIALIAAFAACSNEDDTTKPGDVTSPAAIHDLAVIDAGDSTLTLQWTASGDDGGTGTAKNYQLRRSASVITGANFSSALPVLNPPVPAVAGTVQQFIVTGIDTTAIAHFAIKAVDDVGNVSIVSNDAAWNPTGDAIPPARIADLTVTAAGNDTLTIQWTAPGDDGVTGTAASYEVRWSLSAINEANFASATLAPGAPAPAISGTVQQFTIFGINTAVVTHVAMRATDDAANSSLVSNDAVWTPAAPQHLVKTLPPFKDNSIFEEDGALSNALLPYLFTGRTQGLAGTAVLRRALLAFDILNHFPAGAVIDSVELTMHVSKERTSASRATSLHLVSANWGEGTSDSGGAGGGGGAASTNDATWVYSFFNTVTWTTPGGDFAAGASATTNISTLGFYTWKSAQMTSDVQSWLDTPDNNFGWIILGDESGTVGTAKRLDSRENPTTANRPALKVFYTIP